MMTTIMIDSEILEIANLTDEQIETLWATEEATIICPDCLGASQDSDDAPHCAACEDFGCFSNPRHPGNWEE